MEIFRIIRQVFNNMTILRIFLNRILETRKK